MASYQTLWPAFSHTFVTVQRLRGRATQHLVSASASAKGQLNSPSRRDQAARFAATFAAAGPPRAAFSRAVFAS